MSRRSVKDLPMLFGVRRGRSGIRRPLATQRRGRIVAGLIGVYGARAVSIIVGVVSVPLAIDELGPERYGVWMTITGTISLLVFADLGIGNGLVNRLSALSAKQDVERSRAAVSTAFVLLAVVSAILMAAFAIAHSAIDWARVFGARNSVAAPDCRLAVLVAFTCFFLAIPFSTARHVQLGLQAVHVASLWDALGAVLGLALLALAVHFHAGLAGAVAAVSGGRLLGAATGSFVQFLWITHSLRPKVSAFDWALATRLIRTGGAFVFLNACQMAGFCADPVIIAHTLGPAAVTRYTIVQRLFMVGMSVGLANVALWPAYGEALAHGELAWVRRTLSKHLLGLVGTAVAYSVLLVAFGQNIVRAWIGPQYAPSRSLLLAFGAMAVINAYVGAVSAVLYNEGALRSQTIIFGLASLASLILKVPLTAALGLPGVLLATAVGYGALYVVPSLRVLEALVRSDRRPLGAEYVQQGAHDQRAR